MPDINDGFARMLEGIRIYDNGRDIMMEGLQKAWDGTRDLQRDMADLKERVEYLERVIKQFLNGRPG